MLEVQAPGRRCLSGHTFLSVGSFLLNESLPLTGSRHASKHASPYTCMQSFICLLFLVCSHPSFLPSCFRGIFQTCIVSFFEVFKVFSHVLFNSLLHPAVPSSQLLPCPLVHCFFLPLLTQVLSSSWSWGLPFSPSPCRPLLALTHP